MMAGSREEKKSGGLLFGPILICIAIAAMWKNEGRFDYHLAAKATDPIAELAAAEEGQLISYTEAMDLELLITGGYVESFKGYLIVKRYAEIYCWDRSEDDEGHVTWKKRWMSSVQSNSRNRGLSQRLSSKEFRPPAYQIGKLAIEASAVEFVDDYMDIPSSALRLSSDGKSERLSMRGNYFHRGTGHAIGDERVSFSGVPVPATGTYFGKYEGARGVPHQAVARGGLIDDLIRDSGVLHHIVAGERDTALVTMKEHLTRLKWIIRICGFAGVSSGFFILFGFAVGLLYHIPVLGYLVEKGVFIVSVLLGFIVSSITIGMSYMVHHPMVLVLSLFAFIAAFLLLRNKAFASQQRIKERVDRDVGHSVDAAELAELQFVQLLRLANKDGNIDIEERKYLKKWAQRHRWSKEKVAELVGRANGSEKVSPSSDSSGEQLRSLIRLALADGELHRYEFNAINDAARQFGYSSSELAKTIREVRAEA